MIKKYSIDYPSFNGLEKRNVYIYLPRGYSSSNKRYPVLYMFDGHNVFYDEDATFGRSWRLGEYLDSRKVEIIVVGVECNKGKHHLREIEYSPYPQKFTLSKIKNYGDETIRWFINELKPSIDNEYKTLSDREHTYIMGSSMGGIMATYALLKYNNCFCKACSLSPAYFLYPECIYDLIKNCKVKKDTVLYTDYGTSDLKAKKTIPFFSKANELMIEKGINVTSRIIKDGVHNEASWEKQLIFAINVLMYE